MDNSESGICARLAEIRRRHFGKRGKARFARELGIRPTTYHHYEIDRTPPAELLVRAARCTATSLVWLLTGEGEVGNEAPAEHQGETEALVRRMRLLLARRPSLSRSVHGFFNLLEDVADALPEALDSYQTLRTEELVPVLGSTAAGPARFWRELEASEAAGADMNARLADVLCRNSERAIRNAGMTSTGSDTTEWVSLVQLSRPDELGFIEFLSCPAAKAKHPQAVAWRIDGDSMAPRYQDGDFVIVSPVEPAVEGYPCVAHQKGQIGVNCKIYSPSSDGVLLVPLNESSHPQRLKSDDLLWAYRVLYSVRLSPLG